METNSDAFETTNGNPLYLIRDVEWQNGRVSDGDYLLFSEWWKGHDKIPVPRCLLPRLGVVVQETRRGKTEDVAALWLHLDNSIGVCFLERVLARPRLPLNRTRAAIGRGIDYLKHAAQEMGYLVMHVRTQGALVKMAEKYGFIRGEENIVNMMCLLNKEEKKS